MGKPEAVEEQGTLRAFYEVLAKAESYTPAQVQAFQDNVLRDLIVFVNRNVPFYRERLSGVVGPDGRVNLTAWDRLPILTQSEVRRFHKSLQPGSLPANHGQRLRYMSSGSGGISIPYYRSALSEVAHAAAEYRQFHRFGLDPGSDLARIRAYDSALARFRPAPADPDRPAWTPAWFGTGTRGAVKNLTVFTPIARQLDWLRGLGSVYLNTFPSNAYGLARHVRRHGGSVPAIKAVLSAGEPLGEHVREAVREVFGCDCIDLYSSAECGILACDCPGGDSLHLQPEITRFEILDDAGRPVGPGRYGRLVVTPLYNFAMPLIRYDTGDLVRLSDRCACGRNHHVVDRAVGRPSNMMRLPGGDWFRPKLERRKIDELAGGCRWRLVQSGTQFVFEFMPLADGPGFDSGPLIHTLREGVAPNADIVIKPVPALGPSSGGKFLDVANAGPYLGGF